MYFAYCPIVQKKDRRTVFPMRLPFCECFYQVDFLLFYKILYFAFQFSIVICYAHNNQLIVCINKGAVQLWHFPRNIILKAVFPALNVVFCLLLYF